MPRLVQTQPRISYLLERISDSWQVKHCRADRKHVEHFFRSLRCELSRKISQELKSASGERVKTCTCKRVQFTTPIGLVNCKHHCTMHCSTVLCHSFQSDLLVEPRQQICINSRLILRNRSIASLLLEGAEMTYGFQRHRQLRPAV